LDAEIGYNAHLSTRKTLDTITLWTLPKRGGPLDRQRTQLAQGFAMGWFIVAAILGFLLFWSWRTHLQDVGQRASHENASAPKPTQRQVPWIVRRSAQWSQNSQTFLVDALPVILISALVLAGVLFLLVWFLERAHILTDVADGLNLLLNRIADTVGHGGVARFLLGLVLGFGVAYIIEQRSSVYSPVANNPGASRRTTPSRQYRASGPRAGGKHAGDNPGDNGEPLGGFARTGTAVLLTIGLAITFLALAAPHVDHWLSHLTTVKLPIGELQVASVTAHRATTADNIGLLTDVRSMEALSLYPAKIRQDIDYLENFEIHELETALPGYDKDARMELERKRQKAKELLGVFDGLISPVAGCVQTAIDNGLSIETVRRIVRPIGETAEQIILFDGNFTDDELTSKHEKLWREISELPNRLREFLKNKAKLRKDTADEKREEECSGYFQQRVAGGQAYSGLTPRIQDYEEISYLYTAALLFTSFLKDDIVSLKIIEKTRGKLVFRDYGYLLWAGYIANNQGSSLEIVIPFLDEIRSSARSHYTTIQRFKDRCKIATQELVFKATKVCDDALGRLIQDLGNRERNAELQAMNNIAYCIAEALSRGVITAEAYQGRAEEYANEIYDAVNKGEVADAYDFLDTYAYVSIVIEARKPLPDADKFKKMADILEKVVENLETKDAEVLSVKPEHLYAKTLTRSHLASARELAGQ
jgi:hypothetical protein